VPEDLSEEHIVENIIPSLCEDKNAKIKSIAREFTTGRQPEASVKGRPNMSFVLLPSIETNLLLAYGGLTLPRAIGIYLLYVSRGNPP
jgi:hypothetical protein